MIQSVSSGMQMMPPPHAAQDSSINADQSQKLSEVLEAYDASNLSDEDAKAIVAEIEELGIGPGPALVDALGEAGIDAKALADQAGLEKQEGQRPPPPPGGGEERGVSSVDSAAVDLISEVLATYEDGGGEVSLSDLFQSKLEEAGYDPSEPLIDFYS